MIIIPILNGYFIGNISYVQTNPNVGPESEMFESGAQSFAPRFDHVAPFRLSAVGGPTLRSAHAAGGAHLHTVCLVATNATDGMMGSTRNVEDILGLNYQGDLSVANWQLISQGD